MRKNNDVTWDRVKRLNKAKIHVLEEDTGRMRNENGNNNAAAKKNSAKIRGMQLSTPMAYDFHSFFIENGTCGGRNTKEYPQMNLTAVSV